MKRFNRRSFIRSGLAWGSITIIGPHLFPGFVRAGLTQQGPDIVYTSGDDPMISVSKLLNALGGIQKFVKSGDSVGILVNSPWKNAGYFTNPDVALSVAALCMDAGARGIR